MRNIRKILSMVSVCVAAAQSNAQAINVTLAGTMQPTPANSTGDDLDYNALPPGLDLLKNAIKNPDGSLTIKAGQQTPEANRFNQRYCESLGGVDATNETDQRIGVGTFYAVVCKGPSAPYPATIDPSVPVPSSNSPSSSSSNPSLVRSADPSSAQSQPGIPEARRNPFVTK